MADKKVTIQIDAITKGFEKSLQGVTKQLEDLKKINTDLAAQSKSAFDQMATNHAAATDRMTSKAKQSESIFSGVFKGLIAKEVFDKALALVTDFFNKVITEGVKGAAEFESSMLKLKFAMAQSGSYTDANVQKMERFIAAMRKATTADDDQIVKLLALARTFAKTDEQAMKMVKTAYNMNAAFNDMDPTAAVMALGATFEGSAGRLSKYNGEIKNLTEDQLKAGAALEVWSKIQGAAGIEMDLYSGKVKNLKREEEDLYKELGKTITQNSAVKQVMDQLTKSWANMSEWVAENSQAIKELIAGSINVLIWTFNTLGGFVQAVVVGFKSLILGINAVGYAIMTILAPWLKLAISGIAKLTEGLELLKIVPKGTAASIEGMADSVDTLTESMKKNTEASLDWTAETIKSKNYHMDYVKLLDETDKKIKNQSTPKIVTDTPEIIKARKELEALMLSFKNLDTLMLSIKGPKTQNEEMARMIAKFGSLDEALKLLSATQDKNLSATQKTLAQLALETKYYETLKTQKAKSNAEIIKLEEDLNFRINQLHNFSIDQVRIDEDAKLSIIKKYLGIQKAEELLYLKEVAEARLKAATNPYESGAAKAEIEKINLQIDTEATAAGYNKAKELLKAQIKFDKEKGIFDIVFGTTFDEKNLQQEIEARLAKLKNMDFSTILGPIIPEAVSKFFKSSIESISNYFKDIPFLSNMSTTVSNAFSKVGTWISDGWEAGVKFVQPAVDYLKTAWSSIGDAFDKFTNSEWFVGIKNTFSSIWKGLETAWDYGKKIWDYGKAVIDAFLTGVSLLYNNLLGLLSGKWIDTIASVTTEIANAPTAFVNAFRNFAKSLEDIVNGNFIQKAVEDLSKKLPAIIQSIVTNLPKIVDDLVAALPQIVNAIVDAMPKIAEAIFNGIKKLVDTLFTDPDGEGPEVSLFQKLIASLNDMFTKFIDMLVEVLPKIIRGLAEALPSIINTIMDGITKLVDALPDIIQGLLDNLPNILEAFMKKLPALIESIVRALPKIVTGIVDAIPEIVEVFADNIAPIVEALITGILDGAGDIIARLIDSLLIEGGLERIVKALLQAIPRIAMALVNGVIKGITEGADHIGEALSRGWKAAMENAGDMFTDWGEKIKKGFADAFGKIGFSNSGAAIFKGFGDKFDLVAFLDKGKDLFKGFGDKFDLVAFIQKGKDLFKGFGDKFDANKWADAGKKIWNGFWDAMTEAWKIFTDAGKAIWDGLWGAISAGWENIKSIGSAIGSSLWNKIVELWDNIKSIGTQIASSIWNKIVELWDNFKSIGSSIASSIWNKIVELWENFKSIGSNIANGLWNKIVELWDNFTKIGKNIGTGLWNYIVSIWDEITKVGKNIGAGLWNYIVSIWDEFTKVGKNIAAGLWNYIVSIWDEFTKIGKNIGAGLWNAIVNVWDEFTKIGKNIGIGLWNYIVGIWDEFTNLGKAIGNGFKGSIGGKDGKAWYDPSGWFAATGGQVPNYLAGGGFPGSPKGTDTVPAWLSPGEFVINRNSALANLALLKQINSSTGPVSTVNNSSLERKLDVLINVLGSDRVTTVNIDGREIAKATRKATEQGLQTRRF